MKITIVSPAANLSGGSRVLAIHAQRLKRLGHEVCIVTPAPAWPGIVNGVRNLLDAAKTRLKRSGAGATHYDDLDVEHRVLDSARPVRDADVPDADVVIATWWETAEWVAGFSDKKGAKVYFVQHHEVFDYVPKDRVRATYKLPLQKVVVAEWLRAVMKDEYGDSDVQLAANGVDTEQFSAPARGKRPTPVVGVMYAPEPWKGCDISLKAFSLASQKLPELRLVAFGHPRKPLTHMPLPADTDYTRRPAQDQIGSLYARCDAWLFGSRSEGFGLPILESMACRTPVIGTPAGAAPEMIAGGGGVLVKPDDPADMARAIEHVCTLSQGDWLRMSDAALATANQNTWEKSTESFESALRYAMVRRDRGELSVGAAR